MSWNDGIPPWYTRYFGLSAESAENYVVAKSGKIPVIGPYVAAKAEGFSESANKVLNGGSSTAQMISDAKRLWNPDGDFGPTSQQLADLGQAGIKKGSPEYKQMVLQIKMANRQNFLTFLTNLINQSKTVSQQILRNTN